MKELFSKINTLGLVCRRSNNEPIYQLNQLNEIRLIGLEITTGGMSGGNCWDDTEPSGYTTGDTIDIGDLVLKLSELGLFDIDTMSLKQFLRLRQNVVRHERSENEYYGNCTNYLFLGFRVTLTPEGLKLCE